MRFVQFHFRVILSLIQLEFHWKIESTISLFDPYPDENATYIL